MKKVNLLSRAEMKKVIGGSEPIGGVGSCSVTVTCNNGSITCSSTAGKCWKGTVSVQCDSDPVVYC